VFTEDDLLPLSALQHLLFCERQCALIHLQQIRPSGFTRTESGGVVMDSETRKAVLMAYQKRKQEEILHPFLGERTTVGLLPHLQAALLARTLRGDLDGYPPFLWK
jgi:CRISPR-associated protein Cas1